MARSTSKSSSPKPAAARGRPGAKPAAKAAGKPTARKPVTTTRAPAGRRAPARKAAAAAKRPAAKKPASKPAPARASARPAPAKKAATKPAAKAMKAAPKPAAKAAKPAPKKAAPTKRLEPQARIPKAPGVKNPPGDKGIVARSAPIESRAVRGTTLRRPGHAPIPERPKTPAKPELTPKEIQEMKKMLLEQKRDYEREAAEIEEGVFNISQSEMSGEVAFDEEYADAGSSTFEREKELSIGHNIRDLLDKVNHALAAIERGTYGICENCGNPIAKARLQALPYSTLCIPCKQQEERTR